MLMFFRFDIQISLYFTSKKNTFYFAFFFNFAILKFPDRSFSNPTKTDIAIKCYDQMCTGIFFPFEDHNFLTYQRLPVYEKTSQVSCNTISRIGNEPLFSRYSNIGYRLNPFVIVCKDLPLQAIFGGI